MEPQLEFAASQFELLNNIPLRTMYFDSIRHKFMASTGLPLVNEDITEQPEPVTISIPDETSKLRPDNEQTRDYLAGRLIEGLIEQVRKHSLRELRELGVLIEAERRLLSWSITASLRY